MTGPRAFQVLLVEDDPRDRELLSELIRSRGHSVTARADAEEGWGVFLRDRPPLVVLDWVLPGTDGLELCRRIRRAPGGGKCVILVVTARGSVQDLREVLRAGADDYLAKPVDPALMEIRLTVAEEGVHKLLEREAAQEALSDRNRELITLYRISEITRAPAGLEEAFRQILEEVVGSTGFPVAFLERLDPATDHLVLVAATGVPLPEGGPLLTPLHESLSGLAAERRQPVAMEDVRSHPRYRNDLLRRLNLHSYLALPLVSASRVQGVLTLADPQTRPIPPRLLRWGESLASSLASLFERIEAEEALREGEQEALSLAGELRRANEELEAFAYSVSHDLRAPLRTMQGFAHTLLREHGDSLPPQARDYARRIIESGRQSEILIRDLLSYCRLSSETLELQEVDLNQVVAQAREQVAGDFSDAGAQLEPVDGLPHVLAHHATMVQVMANLLSNAVKFVAPGTTPRVRVRWEEPEPGKRMRLWVEDNGVGIPAGQEERIFKVFERLEGEVARPGTGIGLAIVRRGVERIGGRVGVESAPGEGSRFWLELPLASRRKWKPWGTGRRGGKGA